MPTRIYEWLNVIIQFAAIKKNVCIYFISYFFKTNLEMITLDFHIIVDKKEIINTQKSI